MAKPGASAATARRGVFDEDRLYHERFSSLSVRDLLDARDTYHVHLSRKENVIATAVGSYLIRRDDPDFRDHRRTPAAARRRGQFQKRTLDNSSVRPWSWPCVLVFVSDWQEQQELRSPQSVVPPFLYLDDGRIVPVCIVQADHANVPLRAVPPARLGTERLCGGVALYTLVQGERRVGSAGCIVTDGAEFYILTNAHVAGRPGTAVMVSRRGIGRRVGTSSAARHLGTVRFSDLYPGFPGRHTVAQVDAGLVRIDRIQDWSPEISSIGQLGALVDFSAETANLNWIGRRTIAFGAVSGMLEGEVRALFYRYGEVGGREYVSDFLIGGRMSEKGRAAGAPFLPEHGDSGLVHCLDLRDTGEGVRPFALQWGGQKIRSEAESTYAQFALASSLAVICRELGLTLVADRTADTVPYWGAVGHFKIAQQACYFVKDRRLREFLLANIENLTYSDDPAIWASAKQDPAGFVPLSDVPDIVWKSNVNKVLPRATRRAENTNHYADMDLAGDDGRTLFDLCGRPAALRLADWQAFYEKVKAPEGARSRGGHAARVEHGSLPFRVWQVFSAMQGFARAGDAAGYLCAAGALAHYVGDSCQPLHTSQHSDGLRGATTGVHGTYENSMIEAHGDELATGVAENLADGRWPLVKAATGKEAGMQAVELARRCHGYLPPQTICTSYDRVHSGHVSPTKVRAVLDALWQDCGPGTILCVADGIRVLASLWEAAFGSWKGAGQLGGVVDRDVLMGLYRDPAFIASRTLAQFSDQDLPTR
jgi:hypothetical protein